MVAANLDFMVRRSLARFCRVVADEPIMTPDHAERVGIARKLAVSLAPSGQDAAVPHVLFFVRFTLANEDDVDQATVDAAVDAVLVRLLKLGVWTSVTGPV